MAKAKKETEKKAEQIDRTLFLKAAKPLLVDIDGKQQVAQAREFASGSLGWYSNDKMVVMIDGTPVKCTVATTVVVIGSKPEKGD